MLVERAIPSDINQITHLALLGLVERLSAALAATGKVADVPQNYSRLLGGLGHWRGLSLSSAQQGADRTSNQHQREHAEIAWKELVAIKSSERYLAELAPHLGKRGPLRVFVLLGGGGLGDALLFSPFIRALKQRLEPCEITLAYAKPVVEAVYAGNSDVACAIAAPWDALQRAAEGLRLLGIYDLVVDIYCFLPRYLVCENSRIDVDVHGAWLAGNTHLGDMLDRFSTNLGISVLDQLFNTHFFNILRIASGLPLSAESSLVFSPDPKAANAAKDMGLPQRYITLRDGCNPGDLEFVKSRGKSRSTKQIAPEKWEELRKTIGQSSVPVVQVGDVTDPRIEWVDYDLRGKTTLSELCFIMKSSMVHVDTEGGLVHLARASHAPAIVFYGTTSAAFFGYPGNVNLASELCGRCWYTDPNWLASCPRGTEGPECTSSIDLAPVVSRLSYLQTVNCRNLELFDFELVWKRGNSASEIVAALSVVPRCAVIDCRQVDNATGSAELASFGLGKEPSTSFGSIYNFPCEADLFDRIVLLEPLALENPTAAVAEMARLAKDDGEIVAFLTLERTEDAAALVLRLCQSLSELLGQEQAVLGVSDLAAHFESTLPSVSGGEGAEEGRWIRVRLRRRARESDDWN